MPTHPGHFEVIRLFSAELMQQLVEKIVLRFPKYKFWLRHNPRFIKMDAAKILMVTMPPNQDPSAILGFAEGVAVTLKAAQKEKPAAGDTPAAGSSEKPPSQED